MGRRPSQPVVSDEPLDDFDGADVVDTTEYTDDTLPVEQPPITVYNDPLSEIGNLPRFSADSNFDLMPNANRDAIRDSEGNPLTELEMMARSLRSDVLLDDDEDEGEDLDGFGRGDDLDDETRNERDFLLSGDEEEGEEAGGEDEEAKVEDEDDGEDELGIDDAQNATPKTRKTAADKAIEERIAAQEKAFNDRLAEMQKVLDANLAEVQRAKAEAIAEKQELALQSEKQKQTALAEAEVRARFVDLEELDYDAFKELVEARVSKWELGRREELNKQAAEEAAKATAEFQAQQVALQRQQSYASYKANLPKGHELMGVEAIEGQGSWADLTAEMHEALSVAGLEVPTFAEFAANFAPMLQAIHQRGFKAGAAKAAQRAARGKSTPPPVTSAGGGSQPTEKANGKPSLTLPNKLSSWVPNYFGDMQQGRRGR